MILGDVEEVITTVEIDDETYEEIVRVRAYFLLVNSIGFVLKLYVYLRFKDDVREQVYTCLLAFTFTLLYTSFSSAFTY